MRVREPGWSGVGWWAGCATDEDISVGVLSVRGGVLCVMLCCGQAVRCGVVLQFEDFLGLGTS